MENIEIDFKHGGNTIVGSYTDYLPLDKAITAKAKNMLFPAGYSVIGAKADIARLADYVLTFSNCLKTVKAWAKACELAGVTFKTTVY